MHGPMYIKKWSILFNDLTVAEITQSNSERKVSILGGDSISHCEKKSSYEHVSDGRWLTRESCLNLQIETIVKANKEI